jgi:hypothetical protein
MVEGSGRALGIIEALEIDRSEAIDIVSELSREDPIFSSVGDKPAGAVSKSRTNYYTDQATMNVV